MEAPKEQVEISFSIKGSNLFSSKVYAVYSEILTKKAKEKAPLGNTDFLNGNNNLTFSKKFVLDYYFETKQTLSCVLLEDDHPIANVETTIGKVMGSKSQNVIVHFDSNGLNGDLVIHGSPAKIPTKSLCFNLGVSINFGNNSSLKPFYLLKKNSSQDPKSINWAVCYKSEVIESYNYPNNNSFRNFSISTGPLCFDNVDSQPVLLEFFDNSNPNQPIGGFCAPVSKYVENSTKNINLLGPNGQPFNDKFITFKATLDEDHKFLDYIKGGTQISAMIAIDFTASNGIPTDNNSLHSINRKPNLYEMALDSCISIISNYDSDQLMPVFGYGAKVDPSSDKTSHCFPLNLSNDPNILKLEGILSCYRSFIQNSSIKFHGPTEKDFNKNVKNYSTYSILTILTDGMINDYEETVDAIVEASKYPFSIIIIGIGPDEEEMFQEMHSLDSDNKRLVNSNGQVSMRDIVQFVEFNKFGNDPKSLSEKVLEEIPRQVEEFFKMVGVKPGNK
jgi:hypothetical protein